MTIKIDSVRNIKTNSFKQNSDNSVKEPQHSKSNNKSLIYSLVGLGVIALGALAYKKYKKGKPEQILKKEIKENINKKNLANLTEAEKEKLIKELQTKTDNPDTKAVIRKLVENGEWDKL